MTRRLFKAVNWRIIRDAFRHPTKVSAQYLHDHTRPDEENSLFLPYQQDFDVIALRDWLHDLDNNSGGFQVIGCFDTTRNKSSFVGLTLIFTNPLDAIYCRFAWAGKSTK
jgi:hypothetical protein